MKHKFILSLLPFLTVFTSCKKDYVCECKSTMTSTSTSMSETTTHDYTVSKATKDAASIVCRTYSYSDSSVDNSTTLDVWCDLK